MAQYNFSYEIQGRMAEFEAEARHAAQVKAALEARQQENSQPKRESGLRRFSHRLASLFL